jgi:outer membrane protein assembly factor BamA
MRNRRTAHPLSSFRLRRAAQALGWLGLVVGLGACALSKRLPPGERLYAGSELRVTTDSAASKTERKILQEQLEDMARPRPNKRIFGFPYKVWMYYWYKDPVREGSFGAWFRRRFGEPPVLASAKAIGSNQNVMRSFLQNEGYFGSAVSGQLVEKGYEARGIFDVRVAPRYYIDSVGFLVDSTELRKAVAGTMSRSVLRKGQPYRFANIQVEQQRINQAMRQNGYYYFQPDYVVALADSGFNTHRIRLTMAVRADIPAAATIPYSFRNITIVPSAGLGGNRRFTPADSARRARRATTVDTLPGARPRRGYVFETFRVVDTTRAYNPKLFRSILGFRPGELYDSRKQDLTLSRFINVGTFKFVRNRFTPATQGDSAVLDVTYLLTPFPRRSIRMELAGVSKSNSLVGTELTLSLLNRNLFHQADLLTVTLTGGIEQQFGAQTLGVTNYSAGINATISFPRLISPIRLRYDRTQLLPKTNLSLSHELIIRRDLYNLNSTRAAFGYSWRTNTRSEQTWQPITLTYVRTSNFSDRFFQLQADPSVSNAFIDNLQDNLLIPAMTYTVTYNSPPQTTSSFNYRIRLNLEEAGGLTGLLIPRNGVTGDRRLFGVPFEQYTRADLDLRGFLHLSRSLTWANRFEGGVGVPYGNKTVLPFVKQFFGGGPNSLRGFRPRTVGPGSYQRAPSSDLPFFQDGGGDIKLEFNTELRMKLSSFLQTALFADVGNVWMYQDETLYGPNTRFTNEFYKQLAVSLGAGLRFDLSYFVIRFDLASPVRKPWLPEANRWVFNQFALDQPDWRRQNLIFHIAVGHPF